MNAREGRPQGTTDRDTAAPGRKTPIQWPVGFMPVLPLLSAAACSHCFPCLAEIHVLSLLHPLTLPLCPAPHIWQICSVLFNPSFYHLHVGPQGLIAGGENPSLIAWPHYVLQSCRPCRLHRVLMAQGIFLCFSCLLPSPIFTLSSRHLPHRLLQYLHPLQLLLHRKNGAINQECASLHAIAPAYVLTLMPSLPSSLIPKRTPLPSPLWIQFASTYQEPPIISSPPSFQYISSFFILLGSFLSACKHN